MNIARRQFLKIMAVTGAAASLPHAFAAVASSPSEGLDASGIPLSYRGWQAHARGLLEPLAKLFVPGQASLDIHGPHSANGAQADRLESFARPLLLAAHYLQTVPEDGATADSAAFRESVALWFREGLVAGSSPTGPQAWGPDANYHQIHVEMGLLTLALQIAPDQLWTPLSPSEQAQVARWLGSARHTGYVDNNHYFMGIHILEFLQSHGHGLPGDAATVDEYFDRLEKLHRGNGWFEDGINQAYDYYNAYAFNFYGVWWARLHGQRDPTRAARWREWTRLFLRDYEHFFAASGEHPPFGRSLTYRFNAVAPFGLAVLDGCCDLPAGRLRRLCTRNLDFFLARPIRQEQGCLALGWTDRFDASAELYSGPASPYWAAKGFSPLLLPPEHAFWSAPEEPLLSERSDHAHPIKPAMLVVRSTRGAVEIVNAGSQVSHVNLRYGAWKWSKGAYRTGVGYTLAFPIQTNWSPDSALCLELPDGRVFGRHSTVPAELTQTHTLYTYNFGFAPAQINVRVETLIAWRGDWLLQVHTCTPRQPGVLRLGGYALPLSLAEARGVERVTQEKYLAAFTSGGRGTALQWLVSPSAQAGWDARLEDAGTRTHLVEPGHATPVFRREITTEPIVLAALSWAGESRRDGAPWRVVRGAAGEWTLAHAELGEWRFAHWALPALAPTP